MTLPKGVIWQMLRQQALSAIPAGTLLSYRAPTSLARWQATGSYTVPRASSKRFTLAAPSVDVGAALLGDAEHLLDHAAQQQADLRTQLKASGWTSPAWQVVGFYYWAYFLAMATTRLLGDTVWFVDAAVASQLSRLAPSGSPSLGAGTFRVQTGPALSATDREVLITKSSGRVHEQLWRTWAATIDGYLAKTTKGTGDPLEERLFLAQQRANRALGTDWPSALRNLVNYRPGFGYGAIRKTGVLESFRFLDSNSSTEVADLVARFEANVLALRSSVEIAEQAKLASRVLVDFTFLLHAVARELHSELLERHKIDRRWNGERQTFTREWCSVGGKGEWPC